MKLAPILVLSVGCHVDADVGNTSLVPESPQIQPRWALTLGGDADDYVRSVAIDAAGDVIAGGVFQHVVDFGAGPIASPHAPTVGGASDELAYDSTGFVTKRAKADGAHLWTVIVDAAHSADVIDVATDASGNVLAVGTLNEFPGDDVRAPEMTAVLIKLDPGGNELWRRELGLQSMSTGGALAVATDGTVFVIGTVADEAATWRSFLVAYSADGTLQWSTILDGLGGFTHIAVTPDGDPVITGNLSGTAVLAGQPLDAVDRLDAFVARFDASGALAWAHLVTPLEHDVIAGGPVAVLADGSIVVACWETRDSGTGYAAMIPVSASGPGTGTLVRGANTQSISVAPDDNLLVAGGLVALDVDFGTGPLDGGTFIGATSAAGDPIGGFAYGPMSQAGMIEGIAADSSGVAIGARLGPGYDFGTGELPFAGGSYDGAVVMFDWVP